MGIDFNKVIQEERDNDLAIEQRAVGWARMVSDDIVTYKSLELLEAIIAYIMTESSGTKFISILKNNIDLPITTQSIRNRVEFGRLAIGTVDRGYATFNDIVNMGFQKLKDLWSLGLIDNNDWVVKAQILSGSDWKSAISEELGQEVADTIDQVTCPVCQTKTSAVKVQEGLDKVLHTH